MAADTAALIAAHIERARLLAEDLRYMRDATSNERTLLRLIDHLEYRITAVAADKDELTTQLATAERQAKELGDEVIRLRAENEGYEKALGLNEEAAA